MTRADGVRIACFWVAFLVFVAGIPRDIYRAMERAGIEQPGVNLDLAASIEEDVLHLLPHPLDGPSLARVALLGDSVIASYPLGKAVDRKLARSLRQLPDGLPKVKVISLARPGTAFFDYYFLADLIAAARPDAIVYAVNLASFSEQWRRHHVRPETSGWLGARRLGQALLLPLHWIGITFDRLLFYMALERGVPFDAWYFVHQQQARVGLARSKLVNWVGDRFGSGAEAVYQDMHHLQLLNETQFVERGRFKPAGFRLHYGSALDGIEPDHPAIRVFEATLGVFQAAGIPTVVFVTPLNVEFMRSVDAFDEGGVARTIRTLHDTARAAGADFVDLHDLLPDAAFRDAPGHLSYEGIDGPARLGEGLAPAVARAASTGPGSPR